MPRILPLLVCLLASISNPAIGTDVNDVLWLGSTLTAASQPLASSASLFILSFRPPTTPDSASSNSTNFFLVISYGPSSSPDEYPVWVANRDHSVSASAVLTLSSSGNLIIQDTTVYSGFIWSTNTSGLGVVKAQLLDSGNLVLLNRTSGVVWQSFDSPTDTLLPDQNFTPSSTALIANKKAGDFVSGRYSLTFDDGALKLSNKINSSTFVHWVSAKCDLFRFDVNGNITLYDSSTSNSSSYITTDQGKAAVRRMTLDMDGNMRMYTWDEASHQWIGVWMAFTDVCHSVPGLCGRYGVCTYDGAQVTCSCPQGFSVVDPSDLSKGCAAIYTIESFCNNNTKYVEIEHVDYPLNDADNFSSASVEECKQACSRNCACLGAIYWQSLGHCWLKLDLQNGGVRWSQMYRVFLKVSQADPSVSSPKSDTAIAGWSSLHLWQVDSSYQSNIVIHVTGRKHFKTVIALGILLTVQTVCLAACAVAWMRKKHLQQRAKPGEELAGFLHIFSLKELSAASQKFSQKIGEGGFGQVYKGQLQNGKLVAIKQLVGMFQQEKQFRAEIVTLGRIHHINLLHLVGFCAEGNHRSLVYEYMEKGSLDKVLFQGNGTSGQATPLGWSSRFQICRDVAKGLHYLHAECLGCILHCDIKPENVLLDINYSAKVADFGMAHLHSRNHTLKMSTIRGTRGYMAPEWVSCSHLPITAKADVYSYGMLIMEILSGRRNYLYTESSMMDRNEKWCFPMWAYGRRIEEVADARLDRFVTDWEQAELVLKVAFACIQADMEARPSMGNVLQMLEGVVPVPDPLPFSLYIANEAAEYHASTSRPADAEVLSSTSSSSTSLVSNRTVIRRVSFTDTRS